MAKITLHPGGFIKRNYIGELGLMATELADALEVSESALSRLVHEKDRLVSGPGGEGGQGAGPCWRSRYRPGR